MDSANTAVDNAGWAVVVQKIAARDSSGFEEIYSRLAGLRTLLRCRWAERGDDIYHETILRVVEAIQEGRLREPKAIHSFARTISLRQAAKVRMEFLRTCPASEKIALVKTRTPTPEEAAIQHEHAQIAARVLSAMPIRDRQVLIRFYMKGQPAEVIQAELGITFTQFRNIKSRAKARFTELCQERLRARR